MSDTTNLTRRQARQLEQGKEPTALLQNKTYDRLKFTVQIVLPALAVFYTTVATIWGLPYATQVALTLAAIAVLGGSLLQLSKKSYQNVTDASSQ
jgi:hypothetical protein